MCLRVKGVEQAVPKQQRQGLGNRAPTLKNSQFYLEEYSLLKGFGVSGFMGLERFVRVHNLTIRQALHPELCAHARELNVHILPSNQHGS